MRVPFFGDLDVVPSNILWLFLSYVMLRIGGKEFVVYHVNRTQSRKAGKKRLLILISLPLALRVHHGNIRRVSSIPCIPGTQGLQELDVWHPQFYRNKNQLLTLVPVTHKQVI